MRFFTVRFALLFLLTGSWMLSFSQVKTNDALLQRASVQQAEKEKKLASRLLELSAQKGWPTMIKGRNGAIAILSGVDDNGLPLYLSTQNNIVAAATIGTNKVWAGGSSGLSLSGSSNNVKDKLAIWDGAAVRGTHVELANRILQKDNASSSVPDNVNHATHVAGTMIATGINPLAKGMSYGLQEMLAYDFNNDISEMMGAGANLLVSNHSYGYNAGWNFNAGDNRWEYWGAAGSTKDYKFGYYSSETQLWDSIAYNAPYYLMVKSAGNSRDENGPAVGQPYYRFNASGNMTSAGNRPAGISSNDSYDIISTTGTAKNILTVGAINPISAGYSRPQDVVMSSFSSWGPTDDGRIKPDVVADGVDLLSSFGTADDAYGIFSGTSMSTPNASGSLLLLQEYYSQLHAGSFMRAATLKGLIIHTADEAGNDPGPDYQSGWGLINIAKAAAVIKANNSTQIIQENVLNNGGTFSLPVIASGNGPLVATLSWTDPKGDVVSSSVALDNTSKKLVDDLDMVIKKGTTAYHPWVLDPANPAAAATTGDNTIDNVEKAEVTDIVPGDSYSIEISHKGALQRGTQAYSLIVSGVGSLAYCSSAAGSTAGARIDSVSFGSIQKKNAAGCTSYTDNKNLVGTVSTGTAIPFFARLNSCDASSADKILKVYIDANNDGDFTDAGETLATSAVINGNGDYNGSITIPSGIAIGNYSVLRIVMEETNSAAVINPCGSYAKGETQDYLVQIGTPAKDVGISELLSPIAGDCAEGTGRAVVRIRNLGTGAATGVPVTVVVKQGATIVATLTGTYPAAIPANSDVVYVLQTPFTLAASTAYTFTSSTSLSGDQNATNDQLVVALTTSAASSDPSGTASICGASASLKANAAGSAAFSWYNSSSIATPIAGGANAPTTSILPTYYLQKNDNGLAFSPANKDVFPAGNYDKFDGNFAVFTTDVPVVLKTARLYIGNANNAKKLNLIVGRNFTVSGGNISYIPDGTATLDIYTTDPTPVDGMQGNDVTDNGAVFYLNIAVNTPGEHFILVNNPTGDIASIYRNNGITTSPYPIGVPGIFAFTKNSVAYQGTGDFQQFYYFFYDLKLALPGCPSNRVAIVPTTTAKPLITVTGNVLSSSYATGNQWFLNGGAISGATNQTWDAVASGTYTVQNSGAGCTVTSDPLSFTPTPVTNVNPAEIGLTVMPNPAKGGQFNIKLQVNTRADLDISLLNTVGQRVYHSAIPGFTGQLNKEINGGKLSPGVYYLQIIHDNKMYIRKLVITE